MAENSFGGTQTPLRVGGRIPAGHILVCDKWKGTVLTSILQSGTNVIYEDNLGVVDFYPSCDMGVVYVTEGELVTNSLYRRKLVKLRKANMMKGVVLGEKTHASAQYFGSLQKLAVLELGLTLHPVTSQTEAANLLIQMVQVENHPQRNPFTAKKKHGPLDKSVLMTLQTVPRLGEVKALALLDHFHSIHGICAASEKDLSSVVGTSLGPQLHRFFNQPPES